MSLGLTFLLALFGAAPMVLAATSATATTPEFRISVKHDGVRASAGEETLRYSTLWDGGSNETAKVTIVQDGATLVENLTGEGDRAWSVTRNGMYNLTHTTYTNGEVAAVLNATFVVTGKDEPFPAESVTVVDGDPNIATTNDFTLTYSGKTGAGKFPVTITGTNNYCGMVTKEFSIMKRPVAPLVIPSSAYNGKTRTPTVPTDSRWTVVSNPGGKNAGEYTNVVLRLTNTTDYKWKGYARTVSTLGRVSLSSATRRARTAAYVHDRRQGEAW